MRVGNEEEVKAKHESRGPREVAWPHGATRKPGCLQPQVLGTVLPDPGACASDVAGRGRGCTKKPTAPSEGHEKRAKIKTKQAGKNKTMPTGCAKHFPQQLIRQQGHAADEWHTLGYAKEHRDRQLRAHHWISFGPPEPYPLAHQRLRSQLPRRRLFLQYRGVFLALAANSA